MKKEILDFKQGLSIQELEDRHELTIAVAPEGVEADKEDSEFKRRKH